jgi:hypothetical protein
MSAGRKCLIGAALVLMTMVARQESVFANCNMEEYAVQATAAWNDAVLSCMGSNGGASDVVNFSYDYWASGPDEGCLAYSTYDGCTNGSGSGEEGDWCNIPADCSSNHCDNSHCHSLEE